MIFRPHLCVCLFLGAIVASGATAQPDTQSTDPDVIVPTPTGQKKSTSLSGTLGDLFKQIGTQQPIRRAGMRASVLRTVQRTVPMVMIVEDADSYLFAISNWEGPVRFPILWDDGSVDSHEDIARFVRAFKPDRVVRLTGKLDTPWAGSRDDKQMIFEQVLGSAIDESQPRWNEALDALGKQGIISPGIVITDVLDPAWTAALALSAGRVQPISFVTKANSAVYSPLSSVDADSLERSIEHAANASGNTWKEIGDDIDAITLAINTGTIVKGKVAGQALLATTDRIGRMGSDGSGDRWAWCGQIIGNESRCVYQAMCALFLTIDQAFVWDGYGSDQPWAIYDGTAAGDNLRDAGFNVEVNDQPKNHLKNWKFRMVRPVGDVDGEPGSAGLFLMNSKGAANVFDLPGVVDGLGKPGHMPILSVPTALHMVHSFSVQKPTNRDTVGGRLLERGVFVYAGSVDEPYLQAFVPTPAIARRLAGSIAFASAIHFDDSDVWKITVLGDPLVTVGKAGRRIDGSITVPGSIDLEERYKQRLKDGAYQGAVEDLSLLGRDQSIARIAMALMKDKPEAFGPDVARASIPALFRTGDYEEMIDAYERLDAKGQVDHLMQDMLWLSSPYLMARSSGDPAQRARIEALLRANLRTGQKIHDAEDLAMHMRKRSVESAVGVLEALRPTLYQSQMTQLDRAIDRVRR